jgi:catechol 2,3-dioxygenase
MALLNPNFTPSFNITRISHIVLTSIDLDASQYFYETGLGLEVTFRDSDSLCLRAIEETSHHSLVFYKVPSNKTSTCRSVGYRVQTNDDLQKAYDYFSERGDNVKFVDRAFQGLTLQVTDGVSVPLEFCAEMEQSTCRMQNFHHHAGGKLAFFDHIQIATPDVAGAYQWYSDLGFRLSEYTAADGTDEMWGVWLKRKNNTQDVVFSNGAGPQLHHFAYHTPEIANVIHAADVMASLGLAGSMDRAPGRHGIGNAFFIYFRDPDGHRVEIFTSHYNFIDVDHAPKRWDLSDTTRSQLWGFPAPKKWFYEATTFEDVPITPPTMAAAPVTLEDFLAKDSEE